MAFNWRKFPWTNLHDLNLDWIIQTVKTLEENLAHAIALVQTTVDTAITKLLTGSGDLTINKTGDVNITGNNVRITSGSHAQITGGALISDTSEQLTLHNPNSKKSMTANYNSGVLTLTNNQDMAAGVAVYPINTPADGGGDNSDFAANVGYVKDAVTSVDGKLDTEISNRTSGDAALQSTIDSVIMPLINGLGKRAPRVIYASIMDPAQGTLTLTAEQIAPIKTALLDHTPVMLCVDSTLHAQQFFYQLDNCEPIPASGNIDGALTLTFKTVSGGFNATLALSSGVITFT